MIPVIIGAALGAAAYKILDDFPQEYAYKKIAAVGRLAEYRYFDMDDAVKRAPEIFDELWE